MSYDSIIKKIENEGTLSKDFIFFMFIGSTISILGLLKNAQFFVIASMLISPLSGPIVLLGLSLAHLKFHLFKKGFMSLLIAAIIGLTTSYLLTYISPIQGVTDEIMLRTTFSIYDFIISVLIGGLLGYELTQTREHRNIGVMIGAGLGVSLMPPLAVIGYGLAMQNYTIATSASILFIINIGAIILGTSIILKYFEFKRHTS